MKQNLAYFVWKFLALAISVECYCPNDGRIFTEFSGSITDGYGDYSSFEDCKWIIAPSEAQTVTLTFTQLQTQPQHDLVSVYSCTSVDCAVVTEIPGSPFSGDMLPLPVTSNTGIMKVQFTSDGTRSDHGFTATYSSFLSSTDSCPIGEYQISASSCAPCTNKPATAVYTSNGGTNPFDCLWDCPFGSYYHMGSCTTSSGPCPVGEYVDMHGSCNSCANKPYNAYYTSNGGSSPLGCSWDCYSGFYNSGGRCSANFYDDPATIDRTNRGFTIFVSLLAITVLLPIVAVSAACRPSPDHTPALQAATHHLRSLGCCICLSTPSARRAAACASLFCAALVLAFSAAADATCTPAARLGLVSAALFLHMIASVVLYSCSSCGCTLCCACSAGCCDRPAQATSAVGFSLCFWLLALGFQWWSFTMALVYLFSSTLNEDPEGEGLRDPAELCRRMQFLLPTGLLATGGVLASAALLLQARFILLVPDAVARTHAHLFPAPPPPFGGGGDQPTAPPPAAVPMGYPYYYPPPGSYAPPPPPPPGYSAADPNMPTGVPLAPGAAWPSPSAPPPPPTAIQAPAVLSSQAPCAAAPLPAYPGGGGGGGCTAAALPDGDYYLPPGAPAGGAAGEPAMAWAPR